MGTENYEFPLITGTSSVKVPRDLNALARAVDLNLAREIKRIDSVTTSLASGSPKAVYPTVAALQAAKPIGDSNVYIVSADGKWYFWNGATWTPGGTYQSTGIGDNTVDKAKLSFVKQSTNLFSGSYTESFIAGTPTGMTYNIQSGAGYRTAIVDVEPEKTYTIIKPYTARFRIGASSSVPSNAGAIRSIKYEDSHKDTVIVTTKPGETKLFIYVSNASENIALRIELGTDTAGSQFYLKEPVQSTNIKKGKNLFDEQYMTAQLQGPVGTSAGKLVSTTGKVAIVNVKPNTSYTISKTISNRFRIALSSFVPSITVDNVLDVIEGDTNDTLLVKTITTRATDNYLILYVSNDSTTPAFLQVEEGNSATSFETYGYKIEPLAKPVQSGNLVHGRIYVADFVKNGKSDLEVLQDAFNAANKNIVVLEPNKNYLINNTLYVDVAKVRGIEGQNALIQLQTNNVTVLRLNGTKTSVGAGPDIPENRALAMTEMNPYVRDLRISSYNETYIGTGIELLGVFGLIIEGCHLFNLSHGIRIIGMNRNINITKNNIWNIKNYGIFYVGANVHQQNINNNHISYCRRALYLQNSDMHNMQIVGNDIESGESPAYVAPESLIHFFLDADQTYFYEAIQIVGNSLQDHYINEAPLLKFESLKTAGVQDIEIGSNQLANSKQDSLYFKGVDRATVTGNSFKENQSARCITTDGVNSHIAIGTNILHKGVSFSATTTKVAVVGNVTRGFTLPDSNDGNIRISNNI